MIRLIDIILCYYPYAHIDKYQYVYPDDRYEYVSQMNSLIDINMFHLDEQSERYQYVFKYQYVFQLSKLINIKMFYPDEQIDTDQYVFPR